MEIDIKEEQEKIQSEIQQLTVMANQLQQQRQEVINKLIMKQGQLELLERLNKKEEGRSTNNGSIRTVIW